MDIRQLRYFNVLARTGSISGAAKKAFISQQGLSVAILRLEDELSCRLFVRTQTGVMLTVEGERLLSYSEEVVEKFDSMCANFLGKSLHRSTVHVACAMGVVPDFLCDMLFAFQETNPQFLIDVEECSDADCDAAVKDKQVELGFCVGPVRIPGITATPIFSSPYCLLVNKTHPLAREKAVSVHVLEELPVIMMNRKMKIHHQVIACCKERGFDVVPQYQAAEIVSICSMISQNLGVGMGVLAITALQENSNIVAIPFYDAPELTWDVFMVKMNGYPLSQGAVAFERFVLAHYKRAAQQRTGGTLPGLWEGGRQQET